jgi:hypothetical protein
LLRSDKAGILPLLFILLFLRLFWESLFCWQEEVCFAVESFPRGYFAGAVVPHLCFETVFARYWSVVLAAVFVSFQLPVAVS